MATTARVGVILVDAARHNGPHCGPHISATPRNQNDTTQRCFIQNKDIIDQTDTSQPSKTSS